MATTHIRWIYWVINPIRTRTASASSHQLQRATDGYTMMSWYTIIKPQLLGWPHYWVSHGFPSFPLPLSQILLTKWTGHGGSASTICKLQMPVATNSRQVKTFRTWESECVRSNNKPPVLKGLYHPSTVNLGIAFSWVYHIINIPTIRSKSF